MAYVLQLRRLSASAHGLPLHLMCQLYLAIAVPKMLYAVDLWFSPIFCSSTNTLQRGSIGVAKHISSVQRLAAIAITSAMRTTATDALKVHANLLPTTLLLQDACHHAITRISSLPKTHPLFVPVRNAAKCYVTSHRTSLHRLTHRFDISPEMIETLTPAKRPPSTKNPWTPHIADSKEQAIAECEQLTDQIQIYSDGSGHKGNIGAAAVLFRAGQRPRTLRIHLGTKDEHTVFEAKEAGLTLAARLLATKQDSSFPVSILIDNQASILAGESFYTRPASYLADHFRRMMQCITKAHDNYDVTVCWVPGHSDVHGNEEVDKHTKLAAEGPHNNSSAKHLPCYLRQRMLPLSISALKERQSKDTTKWWIHLWRNSPHYYHLNQLDPNLLKRSFIKLTASFPKKLTSLYIFLCTGHAPLNKHLHRIHKSVSPSCPHCQGTAESVHHFLHICPQYRCERHILTAALGRRASSTQFLLTDPLATPHLIQYVNATGRMRTVLGEIPTPKPSLN